MARLTIPVPARHNQDTIRAIILRMAAGAGDTMENIILRVVASGFKKDDVVSVIDAMILAGEVIQTR